MRDDKLSTLSMDFSVKIINLVKFLKEHRESVILNQIGRSGTSIGANIREAQYAHGKADFIAKLQIALKEANETGYWLELLYKTEYIGEETYKQVAYYVIIKILIYLSIRAHCPRKKFIAKARSFFSEIRLWCAGKIHFAFSVAELFKIRKVAISPDIRT